MCYGFDCIKDIIGKKLVYCLADKLSIYACLYTLSCNHNLDSLKSYTESA